MKALYIFTQALHGFSQVYLSCLLLFKFFFILESVQIPVSWFLALYIIFSLGVYQSILFEFQYFDMSYDELQTHFKNRLHTLLHHNLHPIPSTFFSKRHFLSLKAIFFCVTQKLTYKHTNQRFFQHHNIPFSCINWLH